MLPHPLAHAATAIAPSAFALARRPLWPALMTLALGLTLPVLLSLPKVWAMATRAVVPGDWPPTDYDLASHFNWFFRNYGPEGSLAAALPLLLACLFAALWVRR